MCHCHCRACSPISRYYGIFFSLVLIMPDFSTDNLKLKSPLLRKLLAGTLSDMTLSETAKNDIVWWIHHAQTSKRKISHGKITRELRTDASTHG